MITNHTGSNSKTLATSISQDNHLMKLGIRLLTLLLPFLIVGCCYAEDSKPSDVSDRPSPESKSAKNTSNLFQLDSRNFDSSVSDGSTWLVEFYAPWCGHCKRFESQYELVAKKLQVISESSDRIIKVGKVDGSAEKALSSRFSVKGYPVFYLIDGWTVRQYEGSRSVDAMVKFCTEEYEDVEPIPFINSPFGPMGQLRSILMSVGTKILDMYEYLVEEKKFTPAIASIFLGGIGVMAGVIVIITVGLLLEPKQKVD